MKKATTITLSIDPETKLVLDQLAIDGYNRSNLMQKMTEIIRIIYVDFPELRLPYALGRLVEEVKGGLLSKDHTRWIETGQEAFESGFIACRLDVPYEEMKNEAERRGWSFAKNNAGNKRS